MPRRGKRGSRLAAATRAAEAAAASTPLGDTGGSIDPDKTPFLLPKNISVSEESMQKRRTWVLRHKQSQHYRTVQHRADRPRTPDADRSGTLSRRDWEVLCAEWRKDLRLLAEQMTIRCV